MDTQIKNPFAARYADEHACVSRIEALRWPDGPVCYKCGTAGGNATPDNPRVYRCTNPQCRTFFSVTAETPFAYSKNKLPIMFALLERIAVEGDDLVLLPLTKELGLCWSTLHKLATRMRAAVEAKDPIVAELFKEVFAVRLDSLAVRPTMTSQDLMALMRD